MRIKRLFGVLVIGGASLVGLVRCGGSNEPSPAQNLNPGNVPLLPDGGLPDGGHLPNPDGGPTGW
ncbi:MAG TPA: hypothetical protein VMH40_05915 [Myxococcaceae bacterium]|nr:hypothetical protein [Myxococcaceae bacterium]